MPVWLKISVDVLTLAIMLSGLCALVIPVLPGLVIIWLAALGYGIINGFSTLGWVMFAILTVLMLAGSWVDNIFMGAKAHQSGASWVSILAALVFGIAGNFVIPLIGGFLGAVLALFAAEWIRRKNWRAALAAIQGLMAGYGWALLIRFIMGSVMIGLWMIWAWT